MKTIVKLICFTFAIWLLPVIASAASVTVEAGATRGSTGSKVAVPINIHHAEKLGALQLDLSYDPALLEAADNAVEKGSFPQDITIVSHVLAPGSLRIVMYGPTSESIDGDGTLLKAFFTVKGQNGQSCELHLDGVKAGDNMKPDARSLPMLVTIQDGKFTVGSVYPLWMIIAGAVLLLLLVLRLLFRKRRIQPVATATSQPAGGFCSQCGGRITPGAKFCPGCGKPL